MQHFVGWTSLARHSYSNLRRWEIEIVLSSTFVRNETEIQPEPKLSVRLTSPFRYTIDCFIVKGGRAVMNQRGNTVYECEYIYCIKVLADFDVFITQPPNLDTALS